MARNKVKLKLASLPTRSNVPPKLARKNFLQQLSVALWANNARMILRYGSAGVSDDDNLL